MGQCWPRRADRVAREAEALFTKNNQEQRMRYDVAYQRWVESEREVTRQLQTLHGMFPSLSAEQLRAHIARDPHPACLQFRLLWQHMSQSQIELRTLAAALQDTMQHQNAFKAAQLMHNHDREAEVARQYMAALQRTMRSPDEREEAREQSQEQRDTLNEHIELFAEHTDAILNGQIDAAQEDDLLANMCRTVVSSKGAPALSLPAASVPLRALRHADAAAPAQREADSDAALNLDALLA